MIRSMTPTDYILLEAYTDSEWDACECAILHLTPAYKEELKRRFAFLETLKTDPYFSGLYFWDGSAAYYADTTEEEQLLQPNEKWIYIELSEEELNTLPQPENRLDTFQLVLTPSGFAYFSAYGKHTAEEFWSAQFDILTVVGS